MIDCMVVCLTTRFYWWQNCLPFRLEILNQDLSNLSWLPNTPLARVWIVCRVSHPTFCTVVGGYRDSSLLGLSRKLFGDWLPLKSYNMNNFLNRLGLWMQSREEDETLPTGESGKEKISLSRLSCCRIKLNQSSFIINLSHPSQVLDRWLE